MDSGAPVAMPASPDLEVEGAVDLILLGAEDRSKIFGHSSSFEKTSKF